MGWRTTFQFAAAAVTAAAISRAAESVRRLLEEAATPRAIAPAAPTPPPVQFLDSPSRSALDGALPVMNEADHVVTAQAHDRQSIPQHPPHAFGPSLAFPPTRSVGFQPAARVTETPAEETSAEMPIIYRSGKPDPEEPAIAFQEAQPDQSVVTEPADEPTDEPFEPETVPAVQMAGDIAAEADAAENSDDDRDEIEDQDDADDTVDEPVEPVRALRLTAPPVEETPIITPEPPRVASVPHPEPAHPSTYPAPAEPTLVPVAAVPEPEPAPQVPTSKHKHRRTDSAISGVVRSSRGRGLRGMVVSAVDAEGEVVATATSGAGGAFVIEGLSAGAFRVVASDVIDGDFAAAWHDGTNLADAGHLKVKEGKTRRDVELSLPATAQIDVDVKESSKKLTVDVIVTDRATGVPAEGVVRVGTKLFEVDLPLTNGHAVLTIRKTGKSPLQAYGSKVKLSYRGTDHIARSDTKARLR